VQVAGRELIDLTVPGGTVSEAGVRNNVSVALQYLESWLRGTGAVAIFNLMEDAATAEISRSQLWQWRRNVARLTDGTSFTADVYQRIQREELAKLPNGQGNLFGKAAEILDRLVLSEQLEDFLTQPAYQLI
jgi:malate synthase